MILSHVTYGIGSPSVEEGVQVSCEKKEHTNRVRDIPFCSPVVTSW